MASHFSTIGIPVKTREEFKQYAEAAVNNGQSMETPLGTYYAEAEPPGNFHIRRSGRYSLRRLPMS